MKRQEKVVSGSVGRGMVRAKNPMVRSSGGPRTPFSIEAGRAFTVKPLWGWLIIKGFKDVENRPSTVEPPSGICLVTCTKTYTEAEHEKLLATITSPKILKRVPSYEVLKDLRGKAVGMINYDMVDSVESDWYDGKSVAWRLSRPRCFRHPYAQTGGTGMWHLTKADAQLAFQNLGGLWR